METVSLLFRKHYRQHYGDYRSYQAVLRRWRRWRRYRNASEAGTGKGDHYAYIIGYQDGTIRANGKITRAEVATIFFRLLTDESRDEFWARRTNTAMYPEISGLTTRFPRWRTQVFLRDILTVLSVRNANITRAELAVIAAKFDDLTSGTSKLTDIEGHWAEDYINSAYNKGWVSGYPDGSYMPDNAITRAEVVTLVNRVLERAVDVEGMLDDMVTWSDNLPSDWYYEAIQEATNSHDYERPETEEFEEWTKIEEPRDWSELERLDSEAKTFDSVKYIWGNMRRFTKSVCVFS